MSSETSSAMKYRFLGRSGLQVSVLSLGGWLTYGGHVDQEGTLECMKAAYDAGVNFFDTAEAYAGGESEKVMGEAIRKYGWKRNDLVISTKVYFGSAFGDFPVNNKGLSRKHIIEATEASLKRLQLDYVDVIFAHRPDRRTPMEETVRAFNWLIDNGKAFYWGTSEWDADEIAQAWRVADRLGLIGPIVEQSAYNMLERQRIEHEYAHLYREIGLGLTVWSPMRQGILSGKYNSGIPEDSRFAQTKIEYVNGFWKRTDKSTWDGIIEQVKQLSPIADKLGCKLSQLALAWVVKNENVSTAIMGASSVDQVKENLGALAVIDKLTPEILAEIDDILKNKPPVRQVW
ncbi:Potassium channel, voltage-dependent, beta subunit, KCNAB-related protein [Ceratocystis lukuohia]|uniref:Potassium channel, voltage-dependent, beta subunit, KCNAB-related protein n=2 Tax=Ceratocystis TaxID=5157 RepID=A0ABR4MNJ0_9PEZI|nr:putative voltage-gated potassium channel subunit beta [Ceratocystis fimbriata CBS 114723]